MILVKNTLHKCVFETIIKACSINSRKGSIVVPCIALHCPFCFYLASFAFSFRKHSALCSFKK